MMIRTEMSCDEVRIAEFITFHTSNAFKSNREGFQASLATLSKRGDQHRAVQTAEEQHANWHISDHPAFDGLKKLFRELITPIRFGHTEVFRIGSDRKTPVLFLVTSTVGIDRQQRGRGSFLTPVSIVFGAGTTACQLM